MIAIATASPVVDLSAVARMRAAYETRERADVIIARAIPDLADRLEEARMFINSTFVNAYSDGTYHFRLELRGRNWLIIMSATPGGAALGSIRQD